MNNILELNNINTSPLQLKQTPSLTIPKSPPQITEPITNTNENDNTEALRKMAIMRMSRKRSTTSPTKSSAPIKRQSDDNSDNPSKKQKSNNEQQQNDKLIFNVTPIIQSFSTNTDNNSLTLDNINDNQDIFRTLSFNADNTTPNQSETSELLNIPLPSDNNDNSISDDNNDNNNNESIENSENEENINNDNQEVNEIDNTQPEDDNPININKENLTEFFNKVYPKLIDRIDKFLALPKVDLENKLKNRFGKKVVENFFKK